MVNKDNDNDTDKDKDDIAKYVKATVSDLVKNVAEIIDVQKPDEPTTSTNKCCPSACGVQSDDSSVVSIMCRICYDDTLDEPVISPCQCRGSIGMVHKSCLERWLAESNTNECDLCHHRFQTERTTKFTVTYSVYRWLRYPPTNFAYPVRDMRSDLITCVLLIPFTIGIIYICLFAADYYNRRRFSSMPIARWTSVSVLIMGVTITFGFVVWIYLVFRYHCRVWYFWWQRETVVRLLNLKTCKHTN